MKLILDRLTYSILGGLIMFLVANPTTFEVVNGLLDGGHVENNCPTLKGILVHTLVFFIVVYAVMLIFNHFKDPMEKGDNLLKPSITSALLYFFVTSIAMYNLTNNIFTCLGLPTILQDGGCPDLLGVTVHSIAYTAIVFFMMTK